MKKFVWLIIFLFTTTLVYAELTAVIRGAVIRGAVIAPAVTDPCAGKNVGDSCGGGKYAGFLEWV